MQNFNPTKFCTHTVVHWFRHFAWGLPTHQCTSIYGTVWDYTSTGHQYSLSSPPPGHQKRMMCKYQKEVPIDGRCNHWYQRIQRSAPLSNVLGSCQTVNTYDCMYSSSLYACSVNVCVCVCSTCAVMMHFLIVIIIIVMLFLKFFCTKNVF